MTKNGSQLRTRSAELADGTEVQVWVEHGDEGIAVDFHHDGCLVGRVTATRLAGRPAAELLVWTSRVWRGRGLATIAMGDVIAWAQRRHVPYLHGTLPGGDADQAALAFLRSIGCITAIRTDASGRNFASLVPAAAASADECSTPIDDAAAALAMAALEGGASEPEAAAMYRKLRASIARHPSLGRAA